MDGKEGLIQGRNPLPDDSLVRAEKGRNAVCRRPKSSARRQGHRNDLISSICTLLTERDRCGVQQQVRERRRRILSGDLTLSSATNTGNQQRIARITRLRVGRLPTACKAACA